MSDEQALLLLKRETILKSTEHLFLHLYWAVLISDYLIDTISRSTRGLASLPNRRQVRNVDQTPCAHIGRERERERERERGRELGLSLSKGAEQTCASFNIDVIKSQLDLIQQASAYQNCRRSLFLFRILSHRIGGMEKDERRRRFLLLHSSLSLARLTIIQSLFDEKGSLSLSVRGECDDWTSPSPNWTCQWIYQQRGNKGHVPFLLIVCLSIC